MHGKQPVLLVDFYEFRPQDECKIDHQELIEALLRQEVYDEEEIKWIHRVRVKSGLGDRQTFLPHSIHPRFWDPNNPATDLKSASLECQEVLCGAVEGLLHKTGLEPKDIDILVTTCSIYCPTPSMASMIVNHFKMRPDIQSYHLGGMGCSNGVGAVKLMNDLLQARPNSNALLLTIEVVTPAYYPGKDKHRIVPNIIFRMGGAAMLMSNKSSWMDKAKYSLQYSHREHIGESDDAYNAIQYSPDDEGVNGIYLGKNVVTEATKALTKAMKAVAPRIMTWQQIIEYVKVEAQRRLAKAQHKPAPAPYVPAFNQGVQHFLLHAGGAKVLDGMGKALQLNEHDLGPSRAVLHDYGNVSSSTTWYALGYIETMRGVKAGDKVLQVGVGSGIKCGVNVWKALRNVQDVHHAWEHLLPEPEQVAAAAARTRPSVHVHHAPQVKWIMVVMRLLLLLALLALQLFVLARLGAPITWDSSPVPRVEWAKLPEVLAHWK